MGKRKLKSIIGRLKYALKKYMRVEQYPHVHPKAVIGFNVRVTEPNNLYMDEQTSLKRDIVIMNGGKSRFILKKWSGSAEELMVIAGNHMSIVGKSVKDVTDEVKAREDIRNEFDKDVIVDEDVWMGARVCLLNGVHIGRGAEIGTGTVVRKSIPPYAIVVGNPCKIVGFRFTPEEIIEHEKILYKEEDRLPLSLLEKNYEKYYLSKIKEIRSYLSLSC